MLGYAEGWLIGLEVRAAQVPIQREEIAMVEKTIRIEGAWALQANLQARAGAVYMMIVNDGGAADTLVGASTPVAEMAMVHTFEVVNGVWSMQMLKGADVCPGVPTVFTPGYLHIMLAGVRAELPSTFPITLKFKNAGDITTEVSLRPGPAPFAGAAS